MMRRAPKLASEGEPPRTWRLRFADGSVREPLHPGHIRALLEVGAACADSEIAAIGEETWQRLGDHPLWPDFEPPSRAARLTAPADVDVGVIPLEVHAVTPKMHALWNEHHEANRRQLQVRALREDQGRFLQGLACASAVAGLICLGDFIVFTCSLVTAFILLVAFVRLLALALVWRSMR